MQEIKILWQGEIVCKRGQKKPLVGRCFIHRQGLWVEMISPYPGLKLAGVHIPYFAAPHVNPYDPKKKSPSEWGEREGIDVLKQIYRFGQFRKQHGDELRVFMRPLLRNASRELILSWDLYDKTKQWLKINSPQLGEESLSGISYLIEICLAPELPPWKT